jgi:hypothetical protein
MALSRPGVPLILWIARLDSLKKMREVFEVGRPAGRPLRVVRRMQHGNSLRHIAKCAMSALVIWTDKTRHFLATSSHRHGPAARYQDGKVAKAANALEVSIRAIPYNRS